MFQFIKTSQIDLQSYKSDDSLFFKDIDLKCVNSLNKKKYLAAFSGIMFNLNFGGYLALGNIIPYLASFLTASQMNYDVTECTSEIADLYTSNTVFCNWILFAFTVGYATCGTIGGILQLYYGTKFVVIIGGSIIVFELIITYLYTSNLYVIILCFGVLYGVGCGLGWATSIAAIIRYFPNNKAIITGILLGSISAGAIIYECITTLSVNPTNIPNNDLCGYTLDTEIISLVPSLFNRLAIFAAMCTFFGGLFLNDKPQNDDDSISEAVDNNNYSISEAMQSKAFWVIFVNVFLNVNVIYFTYSDWKLFAQNYLKIENDSFLLQLAITGSVCNLFGRIIWGVIYDYSNSYKYTMGAVTILNTISLLVLPFCQSDIMTFIWICILYFTNAATYTLLSPTIADAFGDKYVGILTGFIMMSELVSTGFQSEFFDILQSKSNSWIIICFVNAALSAISCFVAFQFKSPKKTNKIVS